MRSTSISAHLILLINMIFTTSVSILLALAPTALLAAPTQTAPEVSNILGKRALSADAISALGNGECDLSGITMPQAPTPLPPPGEGLKLAHIVIGRGTQNYTCSTGLASETPKAVGAVAKLFNATCSSVRAPAVVADITRLSLDYPIPDSAVANQLLTGHHDFTAAGQPLFDTKFGNILAKKNSNSTAPVGSAQGSNGLGSVPWLKLDAVSGTFKEVYRLNTAGGVAPKTCEGITKAFEVEYAAEYWFYA